MPTYNEIKAAYDQYCEAAFEIRNNIHRTAMLVVAAIQVKGVFPEGRLFVHPVDNDDLRGTKKWTIPGSVSYCSDDNIWKLGLVLDVNYKTAIFPSELLRITVGINQTMHGIEVSLPNTDVKVIFPAEEGAESKAAMEIFADNFIDSVLVHYRTMRERWLGEGDAKRVIGFNPKKANVIDCRQ